MSRYAMVATIAERGSCYQYRKLPVTGRPNAYNQILLADFFNAANDFKLGDFIDRIDVIDTFLFVQIALMHRVNTNMARLAVRLWFAPLTNALVFSK